MDVIYLQYYNICKDCNFMIIQKWITNAHVLYFSIWGIILLLRKISTVRHNIMTVLIWKYAFYP